MNDFVQCLISHNGLAFATGAVIFLLTAFLVAKRIIGFSVAALFLLFGLLASLAIAHNRDVKTYFESLSREASSATTPENKVNAEIQKAFDDLKAEFLEYKQKFEDFLKDYKK